MLYSNFSCSIRTSSRLARFSYSCAIVPNKLAILARAMVGQAHEALFPVFPRAGEIAFEVDLVDHGYSPSVIWVLNAKRHIVRQEMLRTNVASLANGGGYSVVAGDAGGLNLAQMF